MGMDQAELAASELRRRVDPSSLPFDSTAEVESLSDTIGQPRAVEAIELGVAIEAEGFNIFAAGAPGSGRERAVLDHLGRVAPERPIPDDWLYVHDFRHPDRPRPIRLPAGRGSALERDMERFVELAQERIPQALQSEQFVRDRERATAELARRRDELTEALEGFARERGFVLQAAPGGFVSAPERDGSPLTPEQLNRLGEDERAAIERRGEEVRARGEETLRELQRLEQEAGERTREVGKEAALGAIGVQLDALRRRYQDVPPVLEWLKELRDDIPEHLGDFGPQHGEQEAAPLAKLDEVEREQRLGRYAVNVLVDNSGLEGAPVIVERNPTYYNLIGRLDYKPAFGTLVADSRQIKPGSLQRANGGFLVLDALEVLARPFAWQALKRSLRDLAVSIENLAEQLAPVPTTTLRPAPIPLEVKVVLIGPPLLYQLLCALDEEFSELFKVKADFVPDMEWSDEHVAGFAALVSRWVRDRELRHFDRGAVARLVEHGARLRGDQRKLTARLRHLSDVATEADHRARRAGHQLVTAADVDEAIAGRERRSNFLEERFREMIAEGTLSIEVAGEHTGQVNGLGLIELGDHSFGQPVRVTASVGLGAGTVDSIERETELSDPIHSKGVLTLSGFLAGRYAREWPLALRATITLEQSYEQVGGDSASAAELFALLSALAELPVKQGIAVTGAVDQHGHLEPVGAVTRKIEGFFAACQTKGLTGEQGVMIPRANARHLMLADDVLHAVDDGRFHVWAIETVDHGMELLTGRPAGARGDDGAYPDGTVNRHIEDALRGLAERLRAFGASPDGHPRAQRTRLAQR